MSEFVPSELKVADLRKELAARELPTTGLKKELVQRLEEALAAAGTPVQSSGGGGDADEEEDNDHIDLMPVEEVTELEHDAPETTMAGEEHLDEATAAENDESAEMMEDDDTHEVERKRKADEQASHDSHMETDDVAGAQTQPTTGDSLYIKNLERPLTMYRLKEMLGKYGVVDDVWLNSIKTRGYASFETTEQAVSAHAAINGKRFPPEHGKVLECGFITRTRVKELIVDEEALSEFVRNVDLVAVPVDGGNCGIALVNSKSSSASKKQKTDRVKGDKTVDRAATVAAETSASLITAAAAAAANEAKSAAAHGRRDDDARRASDSRGDESNARSPTRDERSMHTLLTRTQPRISYKPLTDEEVAAKKAGRTYV